MSSLNLRTMITKVLGLGYCHARPILGSRTPETLPRTELALAQTADFHQVQGRIRPPDPLPMLCPLPQTLTFPFPCPIQLILQISARLHVFQNTFPDSSLLPCMLSFLLLALSFTSPIWGLTPLNFSFSFICLPLKLWAPWGWGLCHSCSLM